MASPIPREAPVTIAVRPFRSSEVMFVCLFNVVAGHRRRKAPVYARTFSLFDVLYACLRGISLKC
jgi:hypothetical protein